MKNIRTVLLVAILGAGIGITIYLVQRGPEGSISPSLAPAFQVLGRYPQAADRLIAKVIPVDSLDEKDLGEVMAQRCQQGFWNVVPSDPVNNYLNELVENLSQNARKPFTYRAFLLKMDIPNAFALPGGVIFVTSGLLDTLKSECELASVLAHELGHIELGHCFNAVKFELLSRKMGSSSLGAIADFTRNFLVRHSFSKTEENESDEYSYDLILNTTYDPVGVGAAFSSLREHQASQDPDEQRFENESLDVFRDYFMSHPPLNLRIAKFSEKAKLWWRRYPKARRYVGRENLIKRQSFFSVPLDSEWYKPTETFE